MTNEHTDGSALALILYPFQFESFEIKIEWDEKNLQRLSKIYDLEKLLLIDKQIDSYFLRGDIDLEKILPSMNKSVLEKENLLGSISQGIKLLALSR